MKPADGIIPATCKTIRVPLYDRTLVVCPSKEACQQIIDALDIGFDLSADIAWTIGVPEFDLILVHAPAGDARATVHEAYHAAMAIMHDAGEKPSYKHQEPMAYLLDWLFQEIFTAFDRKAPNEVPLPHPIGDEEHECNAPAPSACLLPPAQPDRSIKK